MVTVICRINGQDIPAQCEGVVALELHELRKDRLALERIGRELDSIHMDSLSTAEVKIVKILVEQDVASIASINGEKVVKVN